MMKLDQNWLTSKLGIFTFGVLTAILWGSAFPAIKLAYATLQIGGGDIFSQILLAGCRFTLAGLLTLALFCVKAHRIAIPTAKETTDFLLLGLILTGLSYLFFHIGLANTTGVKSSILGGLSSFSTILFSHFLTKNDKLNLRKTIGCMLGISGIVVLNLGGGGVSGFSLLGDGCMIANVICFGFGSVFSKKITSGRDSIYVSGYQLLFGGLSLLLIGLLGGGRFQNFGLSAALLICWLGFVGAGGFAMWTTLLKYNPSSRVAIYNALTPLLGAVFSALVLKEKLLSVWNVIALLLVCTAIYVVNAEDKTKRV